MSTPKGLTKQYLRFNHAGLFGIVSSRSSNAAFLQPNRFVVAGGTNAVTLWDTRFKRKLVTFNCESPAVLLKPNQDSTLLSVGHVSGAVSIYDLKDKSEDASPDPNVTFEGHRSEVTALLWNDSGTLLISGSKDTNVIIWDCVTENGIAKLKGHKGPISQLQFWKDAKYILSSSLDSTIRVWNLTTNECVHTVPVETKVWDFAIWNENRLFIGETNIRLVRIDEKQRDDGKDTDEFVTVEEGTVLRKIVDKRVSNMQLVDSRYLFVFGPKKPEIEVFRLNTNAEVAKRLTKRRKKYPDRQAQVTLKDLVQREKSIVASEGKIKSLDVCKEKAHVFKILCNHSSNQMEVITHDTENTAPIPCDLEETTKSDMNKLLQFDGHRNVIKGIAFSSDKTAILTVSSDAVKVWKREALSCILTVSHKYELICCKFCPGDRHFLAGAETGHLLLGDIARGRIVHAKSLDDMESEGGTGISDISIYSNGQRFAVCHGSFVEFLEFTMNDGEFDYKPVKRLNLKEKTLRLKVTPDMKRVAISLLDSTIKVFFLDTYKHHLTLYGHSQPVVGLDISADSRLLVSCSGDKTVRVWGLDFGDCHRSMFHHGGGLVGCEFISDRHLIASVGKNDVNIYDGDNFERIQTLKGHFEAGAACMAVGGFHVVSAGRDQTIRLYSRGDEILVLSDEREREREELLEKEATQERPDLPGLQTAETEVAADKLIEALDIFSEKPDSHPLIMAYGTKDYKEFIYKMFSTIKASELEQSLMFLPVSYIHKMIPAIKTLLNDFPLATELAVKLLNGLMKFHFPMLLGVEQQLQDVSELAAMRLKQLKDTTGFNLAGLKFAHDKELENIQIENYREMIGERKRAQSKKRRQESVKKACLLLQT